MKISILKLSKPAVDMKLSKTGSKSKCNLFNSVKSLKSVVSKFAMPVQCARNVCLLVLFLRWKKRHFSFPPLACAFEISFSFQNNSYSKLYVNSFCLRMWTAKVFHKSFFINVQCFMNSENCWRIFYGVRSVREKIEIENLSSCQGSFYGFLKCL